MDPERRTDQAWRMFRLDFHQPGAGGRRGPEAREASLLSPLGVEVAGIQPAFKSGLYLRPLLVDDGIPGTVPVAALVDHCLAEEDRKSTRLNSSHVAISY